MEDVHFSHSYLSYERPLMLMIGNLPSHWDAFSKNHRAESPGGAEIPSAGGILLAAGIIKNACHEKHP